ncbi:MAG TPA: hypothetical protein PLC42_06930 [Parachlamydiaceae bacterium]|nr:hypothetical protein [Parachlamydiaceae bacterium]
MPPEFDGLSTDLPPFASEQESEDQPIDLSPFPSKQEFGGPPTDLPPELPKTTEN